jgi:hypothetical protein
LDSGHRVLLELIRELKADAMTKAEAAAMWQARAEFLAGQLADAQLALEAPKPETAPEPTPPAEAASRPARGLWSRVVGWFGG